MRTISPKKSVFEVQFFPILEHALVEAEAVKARTRNSFPDWAKNPSTVILMNKERRERMIFESGKISLDLDRFTSHDDRTPDLIASMLDAFANLKSEKLLRVGLREWFAIEVDGLSEQKIFQKLRNRLFQKDTLELGLGSLPEDMAIVLEWDSCKSWYHRRIEFGAMLKLEWSRRVQYFDLTIEKNDHVEKKWKDGLEESLPDAFLFMDVDTYWLSNPPQGSRPEKEIDMKEFFSHIERLNVDVTKRLFEIVRN